MHTYTNTLPIFFLNMSFSLSFSLPLITQDSLHQDKVAARGGEIFCINFCWLTAGWGQEYILPAPLGPLQESDEQVSATTVTSIGNSVKSVSSLTNCNRYVTKLVSLLEIVQSQPAIMKQNPKKSRNCLRKGKTHVMKPMIQNLTTTPWLEKKRQVRQNKV